MHQGKGGKDRVVNISHDAHRALSKYLKVRPHSRSKRLFLVEKGTHMGKPISVRGIQKRLEYYARKVGLKISCHDLRHTMATLLLLVALLFREKFKWGTHENESAEKYLNLEKP